MSEPSGQSPERVRVVVVGAGAAGLMATIHAARTLDGAGGVVALDGARTIGAKILVAGGGRCNVTHHEVTPEDYAGSSRNAIRKVLGRYPVTATVEFFRELGVELKREETGKLFPTTDRAQSVLGALLDAVRAAGAEIRFPRRVHEVVAMPRTDDGNHADGFRVRGDDVDLLADRVILATGGKALPKSGSDGAGYEIARSLGHTITDAVHPSLVPLVLHDGDPIRDVSGIALPTRLDVRDGRGKVIASHTAPLLCTHFGISGPVVLDASRHLLNAHAAGDKAAVIVASFLPDDDRDTFEQSLLAAPGTATIHSTLRGRVPERFIGTLAQAAGLDPADRVRTLTKDARKRFLDAIFSHRLAVAGDRGYTFAEATAGGVPLSEVRLDTMESRITPGLHLAGELLDVDGRVGGFNFQWAWATGYLAGVAAAAG
jgi:predicted Rossmann fold flavoprotein